MSHRALALLREAWDRFLLYVPIACMAVLALGTYWLVRSTPQAEPAASPQAIGHEPDYFMENFSARSYDAKGRLRSEISGQASRHYPATKWLEIDAIRIRSFDENGRLTTATARQGLTNEDASEVQLLGDAVVVREADNRLADKPSPRMEYRGEFLHAFLTTEQVKSHLPVELIRGNDRFSADTLDFDNVEQTMVLQGRVRGILVPQAQTTP